jgi:hypothetical protein
MVRAEEPKPPRVPGNAGTFPVVCPGCGRAIPLRNDELYLTIECVRCNTRFVPGEALAPQAEDAVAVRPVRVLAEAPAPGRRTAERQGFPLWVLPVTIFTGIVLLCGVVAIACLGSGENPGKSAHQFAGTQSEKSPDKSPEEPADESVEKPAIKVTPGELFAIYGKDVIAADNKYTGAMVELADISGMVQKHNDGRYYLVAAETARFIKKKDQGPRIMSVQEYHRRLVESAVNTKYLPGIILYLDPKEATKFSGLGGKKIKVQGRCKGMTEDKTTMPGYFVTVENLCLLGLPDPP